MRLLVAVPFRNRVNDLRALIGSLRKAVLQFEAQGGSARVLLIDDRSDRKERSEVQNMVSAWDRMMVVDNEGIGPGAARNCVQRYVRDGEGYVAFTDSDCIVDEDWLIEISGAIQRAGSAAVIQGVPFLYQKENEYGCWEEALYRCLYMTYVDSASMTTQMTDSRNLIVHSRLFDRFNGKLFSEKLNLAAAESRVFMSRIKEAGISVTYADRVRVYHEDPSSILDSCHQKFRHGSGRVELWGLQPPSVESLLFRYFRFPVEMGIPEHYVVPVHVSFLWGYFSHVEDQEPFWDICKKVEGGLRGITLNDILER